MRIYLNVDGVVNAFSAQKVWDWDRIGSDDYKGFAVRWSEEMVEELQRLAGVGPGIELVWVSSWKEDARGFAKVVGLGALGEKARVLGPVSGIMTFPDIYWKAEAIFEDLGSGAYRGAWAWFDPAVEDLRGIADYSTFLEDGYIPVMDLALGITPEMLVELESLMDKEVVE
jgi:hypothetical protein